MSNSLNSIATQGNSNMTNSNVGYPMPSSLPSQPTQGQQSIHPTQIQYQSNYNINTNTSLNSSSLITQSTYKSPIIPWKNPKIANFSNSIDSHYPIYFRPTTTVFPCDKSTQEKAGVPLGLVITPSLVTEVPLIDYNQLRVIRCLHCLSYLSPYHIFQDGNSFICPFCNSKTMIERDMIISFQNSIELKSPVYDMIPPDYFRPPTPGASFCFIIDLSLHSVSSGITSQFVASLLSILPSLSDNVIVSLILVSNEIVAYDLVNSRRLTICDLFDESIILTFPSLSSPLSIARNSLISILNDLKSRSGEVLSNTNALGSALEVAAAINRTTGALIITAIASPSSFGPTKINQSNNSQNSTYSNNSQNSNGSQNSNNLNSRIHPEFEIKNNFYQKIPSILALANCSLVLFSLGQCEIPTMGFAASLTGGEIYHYDKWDKEIAQEFHTTLFSTLTSNYLWGASTKLRVSNGLIIEANLGNFMMKRDGSLLYPILSSEHSATFRISLNDSFDKNPAKELLFQLATMFADQNGNPRIRIFTFSVPCSNDTYLIRNSMDEAAIFAMFSKSFASSVYQYNTIKSAEELKTLHRKLSSKGLFFESLSFLEHGLLASPLFLPNINSDNRFTAYSKIKTSNITELLLYCYPRLLSLDGNVLPLNFNSFEGQNIMIFHTDSRIFVWASYNTPHDLSLQIFGNPDPQTLDTTLPNLENPQNQNLHKIIEDCYTISQKYLPVEVVSASSPKISLLQTLLRDQTNTFGSDLNGFLVEIGSP